MAVVYLNTDDYIAHMRGTKAAVKAHGKAVEARARALLAAHRDEGVATITGEFGETDYLIWLNDVAALSIEYGREGFTRDDGVHVGPMVGLRILGRAAGI